MSITETIPALIERLRREKEEAFDCHKEIGCGGCISCLLNALEAQKKEAVLTEAWLISRIDEELKREGLPSLSWTDGGGSACPTGWHRNPYLNSGKVEALTLALNELLGFAERNLQRARVATVEARKTQSVDHVNARVMEGREHEALRFFMVVQDRVKEALK
jgi:hypothetical protein